VYARTTVQVVAVFVAVIVNEKAPVPASPAGVPVRAPVAAFRVSPSGSEPAVTAYVKPPEPPLAVTAWL
jgi:hypothetical protein